MKNDTKLVLLFILVIVFGCGLSLWAENSPVVYDYTYIYDRETEDDLVLAFATALRINHPAAYDMIDPTLEPRLDKWMYTHQSKKCKDIPYFFMSGMSGAAGIRQGSWTGLSCFGYNGRIHFEVDYIVIKDMKVIGWGEVTEDGD